MNVASKEELRRMVDRRLRSAEDIARFLNQNRKKNLVEPAEMGECLREAEQSMEARA